MNFKKMVNFLSLFVIFACVFGLGFVTQRELNQPVKCVALSCAVAHCDCAECRYVMKYQAGETVKVNV